MKDDDSSLCQILNKQQLIQDLQIQKEFNAESFIATKKEELEGLINDHGFFSPSEVITLLCGMEEVAQLLANKINLYGIQDASQCSSTDFGMYILAGEDKVTYNRLKLTDPDKASSFYKRKKDAYYTSKQRVNTTKGDLTHTAKLTKKQNREQEAKEIWVTWKTDKPDLYKNQSNYIEDMINKGMTESVRTLYRWIKEWKSEY